MPNTASEARIAERFALWFSRTTGRLCSVGPGDDPPDFVLIPEGWLEVTDIYLSNPQAKFINSPTETRFSLQCSPDEPALRLLQKLDEKLGKTSYQQIYNQRGPGILLLTCQDSFFDAVNLVRVQEALRSFHPSDDKGFFKAAYFDYQLPGEDRVYDVVYRIEAAF
jgi:hypothetical protein